MFVTNIFPPPLILQSNYSFSQNKSDFTSLESKILSQINTFRINPKNYLNYHKSNFNDNLIENILNTAKTINKENKKIYPLKTKKEIISAGKDYLNYLIENNIPKSYFDINKGNKAYFNLQQILSKYGERKGKIFESVIINSNSATEIVNKLIKDEKAIKMILNPNIEYICITSGYIPKWKNICVIVDIIEDFIVYNDINSDIKNGGIKILNEIYLDEKIEKIEKKFEAKTHETKNEITRNYDNNLKYNCNTTEGTDKFKNILNVNLKDVNQFYYSIKDRNFKRCFSFNNNKKEINNINNNNMQINKKPKANNNKIKNLLLDINKKIDIIHSINDKNNKLKEKNKEIKENNGKSYKIITKNLNLGDIKINTNFRKITNNKKEKKDINLEKNNNSKSYISEVNNTYLSKKKFNNETYENNISQQFEQINDISNENHIKKQNSFFSLDTEISKFLNPKKNESKENNIFLLTPNKSLENQEQIEQNTNGFCLNDKERFFKNNRREIKNMIKLYNEERMKKKKIINLRNEINNTDINDVKNTATFLYFKENNKENNTKKIYMKRAPTLSNSYKKVLKKESFFKGINTNINNTSQKRENKKNNLSLLTDNNMLFNIGKKRIISFKANRRLYKNKNNENFENSNNENIVNSENNNNNYKEQKYLIINPIIINGFSNNDNSYLEEKINKDKYKPKKKHIEEINIDLTNYNSFNNNMDYNYNNNYNNRGYIYKKNKVKDNTTNITNINNKFNNIYNTEINRKKKNSNITNTIQNTIKNKYIIINTQIK